MLMTTTNRASRIAYGHDRYDDTADLRDALDAAENDEQRTNSEDDADDCRIEPERTLPGCTDCVALYRIIGKSEGDTDQYGE